MIVLNLNVSEVAGNKRECAALIGVPDPGFLQGIKIGHDVLEILSDLRIVADTKMPNLRSGAIADLDLSERVRSVNGGSDVFEIRIATDVQLLQITTLKANALQ